MAMSKELLDKKGKFDKHDTDLTLCGICEAPIEEDPKALPCLHTFCLGCIQEWAKGKTDKIQCPLCKEDFAIPSEGVSGFRSNFFVTKLQKTRAMKEEVAGSKITCTSCKNAGNAVARCLECKAYICDSCVQVHNTLKLFETHRMCTFDDIRTGKVEVHKLHIQECCSKHLGQVLWFFCESCGILICRDCTVVDHPASTHTLVNVEAVSGEQSEQLDKLASQCRKVAELVDDAIKIVDDVEINLGKALQKANTDVDNVTLEIIAHLKVKQQKCKDEIAQAGDDCEAKISVEKDKLQSQRSQLHRAIEMTDTVTRTGSPYDLAAIYTTLTDTMHKLSDIEPATVSSELAEVKFVPNNNFETLPEFGTLTPSAPTITTSKTKTLDLQGEWEMTSQLCTQGKLSNATGIALYPSGDVAVACNETNGNVRVFDQNGAFKHDIDVKGSVPNLGTSRPRSVVVTSVNGNWHMYVTDTTPVVKVFDMKSKLINTFETISPDSSHSKQSSLYGLAIGCKDQIIVGDVNNSYISIHKLCGTHLSSFKVNNRPCFLASAPNDNAIIVGRMYLSCVKIMNYTGQVLHTLDRPTSVDMAWRPTGICFNGDGEFLIASQATITPKKKAGIHYYTTQGDYLGCITTQVDDPTGVVITRDGMILVLQRESVKVFTKK